MSIVTPQAGSARREFSWAVLPALLGVLGCGGIAAKPTNENAAGSASAEGGASAQGGASGATLSSSPCLGACPDMGARPTSLPPPKCPVASPSAGDSCADEALQCSYGDAPTPRCRSYFECKAGKWQLTADSQRYPCTTSTDCPATPPPGQSCTISMPGVPCAYDTLLCYCEAGTDPPLGIPGQWNCFGSPMNPACPASLPNIGQGCAAPALECDYATNGCLAPPNSTVFCFDGAWEAGQELICVSK